MTTDPQSIDKLLDEIQGESDAIKAVAGPADAPAIEGAVAAMNEIAGDMDMPVAKAGGGGGDPMDAFATDPMPGFEDFAPPPVAPLNNDLQRLLAIEVPVIVRLGMRRMSVGEVMRLAVGAIIEFGKSADEDLDLLANNKHIGKGHAVKVGENFGIKISSIGSVKETIRKLGAI